MRQCSIIDAPSDLGLRRTGVDGLPGALRSAGLLEGLPGVRHAGSVPVPRYSPLRDPVHGVLNVGGIADFGRRLADRVAFTLDQGLFPLVLGGDCSIVIGATLALRRRGRFGLFFIDGHADFYSPETEANGEVASMDLAVVTGRGPAELTDIEQSSPLVRDEDVVVLGCRDAALAAADGSPDVRQTAMRVFDLAEVRKLGAAHAARLGLEALQASGAEGFWIHLDADVLNDEVMPAVDYRTPDGLWPQELGDALRVALASPLAVGLDVTIYNPTFDDAERSAARTLARTVTAAFAPASMDPRQKTSQKTSNPAKHHERSGMTPVDDFLNEKTLMALAPPNAYIDGAAAAEHGSVRILEHDERHLTAEVEDTEIYATQLLSNDGALAWSCTCGEAETHLCRHLVATALATWPDEPPADRL